MDKVVAFFKNVWLKRGVALICWSYTALLAWIAWLSFAYFFEFENATSLFVLYVFVNVAALGLMIYTRRQVFTMINCMIMPPIVFIIVIFGFGNWYLILPPLCVVVAMFFINAANETLKTVLGTMYLLLYVIGVAGYMAVNMLMGTLTFTGVDLSLRDTGFEKLSPSGEYRIVRYIDKPSGDRRTAMYYIEATEDDQEIPFGLCKKVFGCQHALSQQYTGQADDPIDWVKGKVDGKEVEMLSVEGSIRENPYTKKPVEESDEDKDLVSVPAFGDDDSSSVSDGADDESSADTSDEGADAETSAEDGDSLAAA